MYGAGWTGGGEGIQIGDMGGARRPRRRTGQNSHSFTPGFTHVCAQVYTPACAHVRTDNAACTKVCTNVNTQVTTLWPVPSASVTHSLKYVDTVMAHIVNHGPCSYGLNSHGLYSNACLQTCGCTCLWPWPRIFPYTRLRTRLYRWHRLSPPRSHSSSIRQRTIGPNESTE